MRRLIIRIAVLALAAACLSGCGSSGHKPLSSSVAGGTQFEPTSKAFRLTTPSGWKGINSGTLSGAGAADIAKRNPELANMKSQLAALSKNPNLVLLIDQSPRGKAAIARFAFAVNGLARSVAVHVDVTNAAAEREIVAQYDEQAAQLHFHNTKTNTSLAGHPAIAVSYNVPIHTVKTTVLTHETDTILVWHKHVYIVSLTSPASSAAAYQPTFAAILRSFTIS